MKDDPLGLDPLGLDDPLELDTDKKNNFNFGQGDSKKDYEKYVARIKAANAQAPIPRFPGDTSGGLTEQPILSYDDWYADRNAKMGTHLLKDLPIAVAEAGASFGTGVLGYLAGIANTITAPFNRKWNGQSPQKIIEQSVEDVTYQPRTDLGQKVTQNLGETVQPFLPWGSYLPSMAMRAGLQGKKTIGDIKALREQPPKEPVKEIAPKPPEDVPQRTEKGITLDQVPDSVKEQQAFYNRQDPLGLDPEALPNRGDLTRQEGLPFTDSVEAVREAQTRGNPQRDMFVEENQLQRSFDPYQENLQKQADMDRLDLERVAQEAARQKEIDDAFIQRQKDLFDEEQWRKHSDVADALDRVEQKLREQAYEADTRGQGPKTRAFNKARWNNPELGAIDVSAIHDAVEAFKTGNKTAYDLLGAWRGAFEDNEWAKVYTALNDPKSKDTVAFMSPAQFHALAAGRTPSEINHWGPKLYPDIEQGLASKGGLWEMPFLRIDKDGQVTAHEGRHRMDRFRERGLEMVPVRLHGIKWGSEQHPTRLFSQDSKAASPEVKMAFSQPMPKVLTKGVNAPKLMLGPRPGERPRILGGMGRSQRGAIDLSAVSDSIKALTKLGADSPEIQAAKAALATDQKREQVYNAIPGVEAFRPKWNSPEKVIAATGDPQYKDLSAVQAFNAKTIKPGMRSVMVSSKNPLISFMQDRYSKMMSAAENAARNYITNRDGVGPIWQKLSPDEKVEIHRLLKQGDSEMRKFTTKELDEAGYSQRQQEFLAKFYDMEAYELDLWNDQRLSIGMDPVKERPGHFRSVFKGDFWSLAMEAGEDGQPRIVGFVGTNTKAGYNKVIAELKAKNPGLTFTEMKRRGLSGSYRRTDLAQGMADIMEFMAKSDPRIGQIKDAIKQITDQSADSWMGADLHALQKKGIWGNEGNKPWKQDAHKAANEAMEAYLTSWEEAVLSHMHLGTNAQLTALAKNPEVAAKWPRALDYVNKYSKHMTGTYTSQVGMMLNNAIDLTTKVVSFGQLGASAPRMAVNQFTKRMGQLTQGFLNPAYTTMQWLQPFATAYPEAMRAGGLAQANKSALWGIQAGYKYIRKEIDSSYKTDAFTESMFKYAEDRGLLTFSEFDDVSKVTQSAAGRNIDTVIDFNRNQLGERPTRPTVFFTFVDMLKDQGLPEGEIFDTAFNLTQYSMTDYHPAERPLMYRDLGVAGQLAGSLAQYKHSYVNQMAQWAKEAKSNPKMILTGMVAALTLAGYSGLPGYDDLDSIVKYLTNKFGDKQVSINDIVAANAPDWVAAQTPMAWDAESSTWGDYMKYGALSAMSGYNVSSRLGSAQLLPESPLEAVSPYMGKAANIVEAASEFGKNPRAGLNTALHSVPSSMRGPLENRMSTTESGMLINKRGENEYQRTPFDRQARNFGLTSLEESKARDKVYQGTNDVRKNTERRGAISQEVKYKAVQIPNWLSTQEYKNLQAEYVKRGGDPNDLINTAVKAKENAKLSGKQRAEGIPSSLPGINRYQNVNE